MALFPGHLMALLLGHLHSSLHWDLLAKFPGMCSALFVRHLHWNLVTRLLGYIMALLHGFLYWHLLAMLLRHLVALLVIPIA